MRRKNVGAGDWRKLIGTDGERLWRRLSDRKQQQHQGRVRVRHDGLADAQNPVDGRGVAHDRHLAHIIVVMPAPSLSSMLTSGGGASSGTGTLPMSSL